MAYNKADLERHINLTEAEQMFSKSLGSENELCGMFMNHVSSLMKTMYGVDIANIEEEKVFDYSACGLFRFRVDFWIEGECGKMFFFLFKNPSHQFRENLGGITQLMGYKILR